MEGGLHACCMGKRGMEGVAFLIGGGTTPLFHPKLIEIYVGKEQSRDLPFFAVGKKGVSFMRDRQRNECNFARNGSSEKNIDRLTKNTPMYLIGTKKQYHIPYPVLYGKLLSDPPPPYVAMAIKKAKCVGKREFCQ